MSVTLERTPIAQSEPSVQTEPPALSLHELRGRVGAMEETARGWLRDSRADHSPARMSAETTSGGDKWEVKRVEIAGDLPRSRRIAGEWVQVRNTTPDGVTTVELVVPHPTTAPGELMPSVSVIRTRYVGGEPMDVSPTPNSHTAAITAEKVIAELGGTPPARREPRPVDKRRTMRRSLLKRVF